jgi:DNA-binding transcriptional LysR family regulator
MSRKHREIVFHVVAADTAALYRNAIKRNIELAVCRMIGRLPDDLEAEVLFYDSFAIMTSARNHLTRRRKLTLADLSNEPWTLLPFDSYFGSVIEETFRANGREPPRVAVAGLS